MDNLEQQPQVNAEVEATGFRDMRQDRACRKMEKLFEEKPFFQRLGSMFSGLGKSKDSGEYKLAKLQAQRLMAPFVAVLVPVVVMAGLMFFGFTDMGSVKAVQTEILQFEDPKNLDDEVTPEDIPEDMMTDMDLQIDIDFDSSIPVAQIQAPLVSSIHASNPGVTMTKSTIRVAGVMANRDPTARAAAIRKHGATVDSEEAVMRAMRWLATKQQPDGSWLENKTAMTGLALLTFLAHGETPSTSDEFGDVVEKALRYLISSQDANGMFKVRDGNNYSHPIAAYALCEAYSMTKNPQVKDAAEKAIQHVVNGQHPNGGWDYNMQQTQRDDTSYMGWCAQALKAAYIAGDLNVRGLDAAYKNIASGMLVNYQKTAAGGGFGYTSPAIGGLTGVGALALQLTGYADSDEVKMSLMTMDNWRPLLVVGEGSKTTPNGCPQYYLYYATQCMFQFGGTRWDKWNKLMLPEYTRGQKSMSAATSGYRDHEGKPQTIGWWENQDGHGDRPVMDTCLAALQLEVYYRYLPTYMGTAVLDRDTVLDTTDDIVVDIKL